MMADKYDNSRETNSVPVQPLAGNPWDATTIQRSKIISLVTLICGSWMIFLICLLSISGPITPPEVYREISERLESLANKDAPPPHKKHIVYEPNSVLLTLGMVAQVKEGSGTTKENKSINGKPIRINGSEYTHGLGTHANSEIVVPLNGQYKRFIAEVGIDDEIFRSSCPVGDGSVVFEIFADGKRIYRSDIVKHSSNAKNVDVSVDGAKVMRLVVSGGGDGTNCDRADWAAARLVK